jgi:hypothetical protein
MRLEEILELACQEGAALKSLVNAQWIAITPFALCKVDQELVINR